MPKGYWIAQLDITDPQAYPAYQAAVAQVLRNHGGRFIVRAGQHETPEGNGRSRVVVIEFPSYEVARSAYHGSAYTAAKALRLNCSNGDLTIVDGYEGPQPSDAH